MVPIEKVKDLITQHDNLEKESFTNKKNNQDQTSFQNLK